MNDDSTSRSGQELNLSRLSEVARAAQAEGEGDWFSRDLIDSTEPIYSTRLARAHIAAFSPDVVLRLLEIAKAAKAIYPCRNCDSCSDEWNALRTALAGVHE
jgi:hypothetical protein